jgi:hypothetical protein
MFYVAYVRPVSFGTVRPLVFFFNGGPGSASVWLHLGSFAPRRIVIGAPATTVPQPFQLVDNAESLIDVADLVFVDCGRHRLFGGDRAVHQPELLERRRPMPRDARLHRPLCRGEPAARRLPPSCSASRTAARAPRCSPRSCSPPACDSTE